MRRTPDEDFHHRDRLCGIGVGCLPCRDGASDHLHRHRQGEDRHDPSWEVPVLRAGTGRPPRKKPRCPLRRHGGSRQGDPGNRCHHDRRRDAVRRTVDRPLVRQGSLEKHRDRPSGQILVSSCGRQEHRGARNDRRGGASTPGTVLGEECGYGFRGRNEPRVSHGGRSDRGFHGAGSDRARWDRQEEHRFPSGHLYWFQECPDGPHKQQDGGDDQVCLQCAARHGDLVFQRDREPVRDVGGRRCGGRIAWSPPVAICLSQAPGREDCRPVDQRLPRRGLRLRGELSAEGREGVDRPRGKSGGSDAPAQRRDLHQQGPIPEGPRSPEKALPVAAIEADFRARAVLPAGHQRHAGVSRRPDNQRTPCGRRRREGIRPGCKRGGDADFRCGYEDPILRIPGGSGP